MLIFTFKFHHLAQDKPLQIGSSQTSKKKNKKRKKQEEEEEEVYSGTSKWVSRGYFFSRYALAIAKSKAVGK